MAQRLLLLSLGLALALVGCTESSDVEVTVGGEESPSPRPCRIAGQLVDQDGKLISWSHASYSLRTTQGGFASQLASDGNGRFEIARREPIQPGTLHLHLLGGYRDAGTVVDLPLDAPRERLDLGRVVIPLLPVLASGRLIDEHGSPVQGATARAYAPGAAEDPRHCIALDTTDPAGVFELRGTLPENPQAREVVLRVRSREVEVVGDPRTILGSEGALGLMIRGRRIGHLQGVLDPDRWTGAVGMELRAVGEKKTCTGAIGPRGSFHIDDLPYGTYRLEFEARYYDGEVEELDLGAVKIEQTWVEWP